jgi:hypothetical protein
MWDNARMFITLIITALLALAPAHHGPHAVALTDAHSAPSVMVMLTPNEHITYAHGRDGWNCRRSYFTDVSAYSWTGRAIGAQHHDARTDVDYWRVPHHGTHTSEVVFDGATFFNHSRASVLVAGWCG